MDSAASFVCAQCGTTHEGYPTDRGWKLPDDVWEIPEPERSTRAHWDTDLCEMGGRFFIRCILCVPFTEREGDFGWGVWVEVERPDFLRYVQLYTEDARDEPPHRGTLANAIPCYDDAVREHVSIQFGNNNDRPDVFTDPASMSSLARDQRQGIDDARYHEILVAIGAAPHVEAS